MDLGGPNTLIWPRRDSSEVVDIGRAHPGGIAMLLAGRDVRIGDLVREPEARLRAQRAGHRLRARAEAVAEEHGLSTSFLAMGTATWHTADETRRPAAPVLLRRVDLVPTEVDGDLRLTFVADVELNPALAAVLARRVRHASALTRAVDKGRDRGQGYNPEPVYAALRDLCAGIPGFEIRPTLHLGAYPYGKAEAISDLEAMSEAIATHPGIGRLTGERPVPAPTPRASSRTPEGVDASVFDLPEDQQGALDRVAAGEDLFVEAPPGVDAARFVAALVAQAARQERSVLVVAEKTEALLAARRALGSVGLGDLVVHVEDPAAQVDPRTVTERWAPREDTPDRDAGSSRAKAAAAAAILDGHAQAVHTPREPWGVSIAEAHDQVVALAAAERPPRSRVRLGSAALRRLDLDAIEEAATRATEVARAFGWDLRGLPSPWWRGRVTSERDVDWVSETITSLVETDLAALDRAMVETFRDITEPRAESPGDHGRFLAAVERIRDTLDVFRPELFDSPIDPFIDATDPKGGLGLFERRRLVRQARGYLRPGRPPEDLHAALVSAQEQRRAWARLVGGGGRPRIPGSIDDAHRAYERVHSALDSVEEAVPVRGDERPLIDLPVRELRGQLAALQRDRSGAEAAARTRSDVDALDEMGLGELLDDLAARRVPPSAVSDEMRYVWWMSVLDEVAATDPRYGKVTGADLDAALQDFVRADAATVEANAQDLAEASSRRFREIGRRHRRTAVDVERASRGKGKPPPRWRDACSVWGDLLRAAGPCWMMSPLAVGLVLPPSERFDLVVVDDASRTSLARTAGALARGRQVVVVGDPAQQRPGTWTTDPAVVPPAGDAPGLAEIAAERLGVVALRTSGDPRPWLPSARERGVVHTPAPRGGPYPRLRTVAVPSRLVPRPSGTESESPRTSGTEGFGVEVDAEVELVAALVLEALADPSTSLGVLTFDEAHAEAVRLAVAESLRRRPELATAQSRLPSPFIVKAADRWQREQRDRVIVSVGPVSAAPADPGGEQRVGVALTRGRRQVDWVTAVGSADLADAPAGSGTEALRTVLAELEALRPGPSRPAGGEGASPGPLVSGFVERLRSAGLEAETGVGLAAHRVDIAVGDPDYKGYQLAVSIDGPEYASRAGARQRDRILPAELTALGWRHVRLWATDIFADPARQEAKVLRALHEACREIDAARGR